MFVIDSRIYEACGSNVDSILEDLPSWRPELATSGLAHSREVNSFELKVKCTFLQAIESKMAAHGWGPDPLRGGSSYDGVDLITFPNRDSVADMQQNTRVNLKLSLGIIVISQQSVSLSFSLN